MIQSMEVVVSVWAITEVLKTKPSKQALIYMSISVVVGALAYMQTYGFTPDNLGDGAYYGFLATCFYRLIDNKLGGVLTSYVGQIKSKKRKN